VQPEPAVYALFSGEPGREALLWAAVLRAGPDAMLSHHTAAELYRLTDRQNGAAHVARSHPEHGSSTPSWT
jgi:hypothetical protein